MSKRLASFGGPSTPTSSPITTTPTKSGGKKKHPTPRKSKQDETETQRLVRSALKRTAIELERWEACTKYVVADAKAMMDQATELDNVLGSLSSEVQPRFRIVTRNLSRIEFHRGEMKSKLGVANGVIITIAKRANKLEQALTQFVQTNGVEAAEKIPLWTGKTWSLGQHVLHIHKLLRPLNRFQFTAREISEKIIAYGLSGGFNSEESRSGLDHLVPTVPTFEETRGAMALWAAEIKLVEEVVKEWVEMCALEVAGWEKVLEPEVHSSDDEETD
ncbi:unnamed protein product [Rhizoctonia solani]|uniref:Uncharacterized protein n=1 Tax=Rhizoctonia solani TaxID=456999 RepID=A0A8H3DTH1_9AGAM|nr:unnamed protein product [Rhizoctonia solani]